MEAITVAIEAAHKAGEVILHHFQQPQEIYLKGPGDLTTQVDREAEEIIVDTIRQAFPEHEFLGEEEHAACHDAENLWVIDPLDGTRNYSLSIPWFCVSIALAVKGRAVLGVIYDPVRQETFCAEAGKGAYLNGKRIHCAKKTEIERAVAALGFLPARHKENPGLAVPMLMRLHPMIEAIRIMGAAALNLAYVACGRADISFHDRVSAWDILAGALLIEEAGGVATDFAGQPITTASQNII
ncbi:MAG: inositol monophosphatase family protein, partial [Anaerolineae bacterium]